MQNERDRHLDIPAEANREKHINFLEAEEGNNNDSRRADNSEGDDQRRKEWQRGLEEGEKAEKNS